MKDKTSRFVIDPSQLDAEWLSLPGFIYKAARRQATLRLRLTQAENTLKAVEVQISSRVRKKPPSGVRTITETAVREVVCADTAYIAAREVVEAAKYEYDLCGAEITAFDAKKRALENLVNLWAREYFALPQVRNNPKSRQTGKGIGNSFGKRLTGVPK